MSDWETWKLVDRAFLEIGIERRTVFEVSDLETLLELVARDPAIALVPEAIAEARPIRSASTRSHKLPDMAHPSAREELAPARCPILDPLWH
ncbi:MULTISPECIES: LysR substrate-binding domain-containing protein [unclassified Mesorhizobium]|uniref:LysR substrate-binding domain-containing protein n=1 Tax=unclassified Mesorhizobium TaxID=325217 RepID=UPI00333A3E9B